jgi:hypothetical protein
MNNKIKKKITRDNFTQYINMETWGS